ncbi:hypothetical protein J1N35_030063 [Gossypium stocksii]|uniref:Endonuclease/exonuclease/phosphatase domain-containing protein n=1 Tax=Gossypium stocksii TaxID=47602 RepID=A0A9D3ZSK2_9ROSI|nr:hypothetical protein J1N35_030063 [Gossypium stocksii]
MGGVIRDVGPLNPQEGNPTVGGSVGRSFDGPTFVSGAASLSKADFDPLRSDLNQPTSTTDMSYIRPVQVLDSSGGLNPNKHSAVSFMEKSPVVGDNLKSVHEPVFGNFKSRSIGKMMGGCASSKFLRAFCEYNFENSPDIICLLEPRVSGKKANDIIDKLGFDFSHRIESIGISAALTKPRGKLSGDLRFIGPSFTWQRGNTYERIDRALANDHWISFFPNTLVYHLPRIKSDHRPIFIKTNLELSFSKGKPFRFLVGWTKDANFKELVFDKWRSQKRKLLRSLGNIQKAMDWSSSSRLAEVEIEIYDELETILNHEELLWRQKARCDWLQYGDRNTQYFYSRTMQRRKRNRIMALRISTGEWCSDQSILSDEAARFFEDLYGETSNPISTPPLNIFPRLSLQDIDFLNKPILNDEIKNAFFDMAPLKAPGSNGYHVLFF